MEEEGSQGVLGESNPQGRETYQTWPAKGTPCGGDLVCRCRGQYHQEARKFWLETVALLWCTDPWLVSPL